MKSAAEKHFSIFDPGIHFEHREFYERIVSELNGLLPVCNQGKSTAVEISENTTEQEQITELMTRVESFSGDLLEVTKKLFDQYYLAKEALHRSILETTAYNKINTLDRNLLERTCDVRWWALETAFSACLDTHSRARALAASLSTQAPSPGRRKAGTLPPDLMAALSDPGTLTSREGPGRLSDLLEGAVADASCEESFRDSAQALLEILPELSAAVALSCDRLEDIRHSYTLYRDIVLATSEGRILANANPAERDRVLGLDISAESWFEKALATRNGTEYHAQDLGESRVERRASLVYATAVRESSNENGRAIGAMGVFFDFQGEAEMILKESMPTDSEGSPLEGAYSLFTDKDGRVIASTDPISLPPGTIAHLPRGNRTLGPGERTARYLVFEGLESAVFSARTDGYLDYRGLGWSSHVIVPKSLLFAQASPPEGIGITAEELMDSRILPDINKRTYLRVQDDKESIQLISLNGIVFASKLGKRGGALGPIFNQITRTGDMVTSRMEDILKEMALGELELNLKALENFSLQAIDLVDRNLFERAADIRWWATDEYFWNALADPGPDSFHRASERLKVINTSYTMYRNIVLADDSGNIVACSRTELRNELAKTNVSDQTWFQLGMRTARSDEFAVQDVQKSPLEKSKARSLVYCGGVRSRGIRCGESIGVLGTLFDWDTEARKILSTCLPRDAEGAIIEGSAAFYTNAAGEVIETTDETAFPTGSRPGLPQTVQKLAQGATTSFVFEGESGRFLAGSSRTKGYREYEGLAWCAHVVRPIGT
ncbi:MAG: hypothetical protein H6686_02255 [Fibrobacteria bacterium]|nr:hypothetical protein [Fibrobacteria bacterium]